MNVVVPFDLTPASERALEHAIAAYGPRPDVTIHAVHFSDSSETVEKLAHAAVDGSRGDAVATVETRFVPVEAGEGDHPGEVAGRILDVAGEVDADVIVVGYHRKGPVEAFLDGNTSEYLIEDGRYPVTVVN